MSTKHKSNLQPHSFLNLSQTPDFCLDLQDILTICIKFSVLTLDNLWLHSCLMSNVKLGSLKFWPRELLTVRAWLVKRGNRKTRVLLELQIVKDFAFFGSGDGWKMKSSPKCRFIFETWGLRSEQKLDNFYTRS